MCMDLRFITTIGGQVFRIDDVSDEASMIELRFFNEFNELPQSVKEQAARTALGAAMEVITNANRNSSHAARR